MGLSTTLLLRKRIFFKIKFWSTPFQKYIEFDEFCTVEMSEIEFDFSELKCEIEFGFY